MLVNHKSIYPEHEFRTLVVIFGAYTTDKETLSHHPGIHALVIWRLILSLQCIFYILSHRCTPCPYLFRIGPNWLTRHLQLLSICRHYFPTMLSARLRDKFLFAIWHLQLLAGLLIPMVLSAQQRVNRCWQDITCVSKNDSNLLLKMNETYMIFTVCILFLHK